MNRHELETNVLGGLMVNRQAWDRGGYKLRPDDFAEDQNKNIYLAIRALVAEGSVCDAVAVADYLQQNNQCHDGGRYVASVANNAISAANISDHVGMLQDLTVRRHIQNMANRMLTLTGSGREQQIQVQAMLTELESNDPREPVQLADCAKEWLGLLSERSEAGGDVVGRRMGFVDVDRRLGGMRPGDLIVLAGRPAMGKTALAMSAILSNCDEGQPCLMFSLEMDKGNLMDRIVANLSGVPLGRVRSPRFLSDDDWPKITAATQKASAIPFYLDDEPSLAIQTIHARARRIKRKHGLGLIVVDYIQLVETDRRHNSRRDHVAEVSRTLKKIAKDLQVPVVALSQLNRKCEERNDKRPLMSDLYESGAVEQDADAIGMVYRDEVYHPESHAKGTCELIWTKVRNGSTGTDWLNFTGETQKFTQGIRPEPEPVNAIPAPYGRFKRSGT